MKLYVFLYKRPADTQPWPAVYTDKDLAEKAFGRISDVVEVEVTPNDFDTSKMRAIVTYNGKST